MARRPGRLPKTPERRQGHRSGASIALLSGGLSQVPAPPQGISKEVQREWDAYWASDVAKVATEENLPGIRRLFTYYDEWARSMRAFRRKRFVEGSTGQPVLNPIAEHLTRLEKLIGSLEADLGLTPYARAQLVKLGLAIGQAQRTLEEMNRSVDADEDEAETEDSDPRSSLDIPASDR